MPLDERRLLSRLTVAGSAVAVVASLAASFATALGADRVLTVRLGILAATAAIAGMICRYRENMLATRRHLDPMQRAGLVRDLYESLTMRVTVTAPRGDEEAIAFARELLAVLHEAEWPARGVQLDDVRDNASNAGVIVAGRPTAEPQEDPSLPPAGMMLLHALERVGLTPVKGTSARIHDLQNLELFVGRRA